MADKEISELTAATALTGSELVHIDQGGDSRKATLLDIAGLSTGAMLVAQYDPNADGIIAVAQGGTNSATASGARTNLGLGTMAVQNAATVAITGGSVTGITDLAVADGGSGASDAAGARTNFGLVIGTDVMAYSANLAGFAATTVTNVQNRVNHTGTQLAATISDFSTAADLRITAAIGSTVQAYSANLDGWSAIATSAKQDADALLTSVSALSLTAGDMIYATGADAVARLPAGANGQVLALQDGVPQWDTELSVGGLLAANNLSDVSSAATARTNIGAQAASANLTTLADGPDADAGEILLPYINTILPQVSNGEINVMNFSQSGVYPDRNGTGGTNITVTDASFADALNAAETFINANANKGAVITIPAGIFRTSVPITVDFSRCRIKGSGKSTTMILSADFTDNLVEFDGGSDSSNISNSDISGVSLIRTGTLPAASAASPAQLFIRNVSGGNFDDIFIQKAAIGVHIQRGIDNLFNGLYINGVSNDVEAYAGVIQTSATGHSGASFGNYFNQMEINYVKDGVDAGFTYGFLLNCSDGTYISHSHILDARHNIFINPDGTATIRDKLGGVFVSDVYLDRATETNCTIQGSASVAYARLFFQRTRFSLAGTYGCRIAPTTTIQSLEFADCHFLGAANSGIYAVNTGGVTTVRGLKVVDCTFAGNNTANGSSDGDLRLNLIEDYDIHGNLHLDGGSAGFAVNVGTTVGAGRITDNDWSASDATTKFVVGGRNNGRTFTGNKEVNSGYSTVEREGVQQTTNTTPVVVWTLSLVEDASAVVEFEAWCSQGTKGKGASIKKVAVYNRATGGSAVEEGEATVWTAEDDAGTDITLALSTNVIQASVVGVAATLNWQWKVTYRERVA